METQDLINVKDLELLMKSNTETQKMFGDVLHAFEMSARDIEDLKKHGPSDVMVKLDSTNESIVRIESKLFKWMLVVITISTLLTVLVSAVVSILI